MSIPPIAFDEALRGRLRAGMSGFERMASPAAGGVRRAAVAVMVAGDEAGRACFVLTRRTPGLRAHAGQWALPGGRMDPEETPVQTALRELGEEIGLDAAEPEVIGLLDDYPTRSGFVITPVVVWGSSQPAFTPNPAEVASAHLIPLTVLEHPDVPRLLDGPDPQRPIIQLPLFGRFLHAPTAAILYQLREIGLHGRATRVAHFDQPTFAWK